MEIKMTESGNLELLYDKMDIVLHLLAMGFTIAVVVAVIVAGIRLGWQMMPWILAFAVVAYLLV
jgi:2-keto-3-deoxy-galactonokinase